MLGPLLNRKSDLSIRNGVLLIYKQTESCLHISSHPPRDGLCVPRVEVHCPHPRLEAAGDTIQVSSPCSIGAPWDVSNRQIHEDLGVPLFANHIRALTASFDSKLSDVGNPLLWQLIRFLR